MDQSLRMAKGDGPLSAFGVRGPFCSVAVGPDWRMGLGQQIVAKSPINGATLESFPGAAPDQCEEVITAATEAFRNWRMVPGRVRRELARNLSNRIRLEEGSLADLITLETGKIRQEALGEVQEVIDIFDEAAGLTCSGLTIPSERSGHTLYEYWHPLGPIGLITAFNFPAAVWAWNTALALVCGDAIVWKPSDQVPLTSIALHAIVSDEIQRFPAAPLALASLIIGNASVGRRLAASKSLPLISATGSVQMGREVAQIVAGRLGRSLLELGGNNGMIVTPTANLEMALRAIIFAAVGTCGQRCTTLRRLIVHRGVAEELLSRLIESYARLTIGDPREEQVLVGPIIREESAVAMEEALATAVSQGGKVHGGGRKLIGVPAGGIYVQPAIVEIDLMAPIVQRETFAPILYVSKYDELTNAIEIHNSVPQGLASAIFTNDITETMRFCAANGSDCGIVNVNTGPSGAEIAGAFGGEKETGGGREAGSDSWKAYMRRSTVTLNYSGKLSLAQGISFRLS
jgi:aldehyde dehydrogenase (NAD+)